MTTQIFDRPNTAQTPAKHRPNAGQTLVKHALPQPCAHHARILQRHLRDFTSEFDQPGEWSNNGQNTGQTLVKHWPNTHHL
jgi:hypothetical protein